MINRRGFLAAGTILAVLGPGFAFGADSSEIAKGVFRDGDPVHRGSGTLSIRRMPGGETFVRMVDMKIVPGPNLFVYLVKEPDPLFPEDVTAGFTSLGKLQGLTGTQDYPVPDGVNIDDWGSVVVWCATFKTAFTIATIRRGS